MLLDPIFGSFQTIQMYPLLIAVIIFTNLPVLKRTNGKSIIVLPQGILTFQSGFKKYYEPIVNGDVLVMSTFFPKAGWDVGYAMARNAYIYGLAKEIYIAESDSKGGTWQGALDGLKKHRKMYVRQPEPTEKNANLKLIQLGLTAVDMNGIEISSAHKPLRELFQKEVEENVLHEPETEYIVAVNVENQILDLLKDKSYTAKEIIKRRMLPAATSNHLNKFVPGNISRFFLKN